MNVLQYLLVAVLILYIEVVVLTLIRHKRRPRIWESMLPPAIGMLSRLVLAAVVVHFSQVAFISDAAAPSATASIAIALPSTFLVIAELAYWIYAWRVFRDLEGSIERGEPLI